MGQNVPKKRSTNNNGHQNIWRMNQRFPKKGHQNIL